MSKVFGRYHPAHPYNAILDMWEKDTDPKQRALAINIRCDHRVSHERERSFDSETGRPRTDSALARALVDYYQDRIHRTDKPDFVKEKINRENIVFSRNRFLDALTLGRTARARAGAPARNVRLASVLDLNGLRIPFQWASPQRRPAWQSLFAGLSGWAHGTNFDAWLDGRLGSSTDAEKDEFITLTLQVLDAYRRKHPFHPTWATSWNAFERHIAEGPNRWVQMVGAPRLSGRWQIVLKYAVGETGTLARPTQLDGGDFVFHFPSPPFMSPEKGGVVMDLRIAPPPNTLRPEFVHKQIQFTELHWRAGGRLLGQTTSYKNNLVEQRLLHYQLLRQKYYGVRSWMPQPI